MRRLVLALVVLLLVVAGFLTWKTLSFLYRRPAQARQNVVFEVKPGQSFRQVATELKANNLITDVADFRLLARAMNASTKIRVGEYALNTRMRPWQILKTLMSGKSIEYPFTIQEGLNMYEIAQAFQDAGLGKKEDFLTAAKDPHLIQQLLGEKLPSLEGYLFPETYFVTKYTGARHLVVLMVNNFKRVYKEVERHNTMHMPRHQVVTLASLIEKETGAANERPVISSVFHNRLKKHMRLQSDPTILYGILVQTEKMPKNITRQDIHRRNPYNTYTISGLPYGPIANPGKESLLAAVQPADTDYLYFVSKNDGTHVFTTNFRDHTRAVRKWQLNRANRIGHSWRDRLKKTAAH